MTSPEAAQRLGRLVRQRRKQLGMTQADIQAAHGPSTATLRLIENGRHIDFRASTSDPLERILGWAPGSINSILAGGDPTLSVGEQPAPLPANEQHQRLYGFEQNAVTRIPAEQAFMYLDDVTHLLEVLTTQKDTQAVNRALNIVRAGTLVILNSLVAGVPPRMGQQATNRMAGLMSRIFPTIKDGDEEENLRLMFELTSIPRPWGMARGEPTPREEANLSEPSAPEAVPDRDQTDADGSDDPLWQDYLDTRAKADEELRGE